MEEGRRVKLFGVDRRSKVGPTLDNRSTKHQHIKSLSPMHGCEVQRGAKEREREKFT
jgi:hypothetical protein